jgi:hypothetical protein
MSRRHRRTAETVSLGSDREYWMGLVVGYVAAVLTSVGLLLAFVRHGL